MAQDHAAGDGDEFVAIRSLRAGSIVTIGRHRIELIEGRARIRVIAADGQHVKFSFDPQARENDQRAT